MISKAGETVEKVCLIAFGSVQMCGEGACFSAEKGPPPALGVGEQMGHVPLMWAHSQSPVGYSAKGPCVLLTVRRGAYHATWHGVHDSEDVQLCGFLRAMPLLRGLSLTEVLCLKQRLTKRDLARGSKRLEREMGDDVYIVYQGECQLCTVKRQDSTAATRLPEGLSPRSSKRLAPTPVAAVGRFNAFGPLQTPVPDGPHN